MQQLFYSSRQNCFYLRPGDELAALADGTRVELASLDHAIVGLPADPQGFQRLGDGEVFGHGVTGESILIAILPRATRPTRAITVSTAKKMTCRRSRLSRSRRYSRSCPFGSNSCITSPLSWRAASYAAQRLSPG